MLLHPQRARSPSCGRPVAAALRAPPPPTPSISFLVVSAFLAAIKQSLASLFGESSIPSACQSSPSVVDDCPVSPDCPIRKFARPPGPSDRSPGSIPPGAASPRPAPRSPLRGLRRSGDDPWRLRSLPLAARFACRPRRHGPVFPPPWLGRSAPVAGGSPGSLAEALRRLSAARFPPTASQQARR